MLSKTFTNARRVTPLAARSMSTYNPSLEDAPKRVLVSGAAGQIAYSIVYRIAR
jgi:hypothetical protein